MLIFCRVLNLSLGYTGAFFKKKLVLATVLRPRKIAHKGCLNQFFLQNLKKRPSVAQAFERAFQFLSTLMKFHPLTRTSTGKISKSEFLFLYFYEAH
jgi:hypothetical protein